MPTRVATLLILLIPGTISGQIVLEAADPIVVGEAPSWVVLHDFDSAGDLGCQTPACP